jgi:hypothetical protein
MLAQSFKCGCARNGADTVAGPAVAKVIDRPAPNYVRARFGYGKLGWRGMASVAPARVKAEKTVLAFVMRKERGIRSIARQCLRWPLPPHPFARTMARETPAAPRVMMRALLLRKTTLPSGLA